MADENKPTGDANNLADSQTANQNAGDQPEPNKDTGQEGGDGQEPGGQGGAEARIKKLAADKKKLAQEAEHWKNIAARFAQMDDQATRQPPAQPNQNQNQYGGDEVERAYRTLAQRGMATTEDLERMAVRLKWDRVHDQNENRYNRQGSKYPEYVREDVEEYARNHNIGDPTAAYQNMYFDEILDAVKSETRGRPANTSEHPTKPSNTQKEPLTLEAFREKLSTDRGFYDELSKDPAKFDALMSELATA